MMQMISCQHEQMMVDMAMSTAQLPWALAIGAASAAVLIVMVIRTAWPLSTTGPTQDATTMVGELLLSRYMIGFEGAAFLILAGMVGKEVGMSLLTLMIFLPSVQRVKPLGGDLVGMSLLTLMIFLPLIGALALALLPDRRTWGWAAASLSGVVLTLGVALGLRFDWGSGALQFQERTPS